LITIMSPYQESSSTMVFISSASPISPCNPGYQRVSEAVPAGPEYDQAHCTTAALAHGAAPVDSMLHGVRFMRLVLVQQVYWRYEMLERWQ
jgi:hypothetical protein